tara:strand:+ start:6223 stop:6729 length:507 start_codon:yes stop_codon:yes gene_type:complete
MVCDNPSNCSSCDEIRVVPWVQDYPFIFDEEYTQNQCEIEELEWTVGDQILHDNMDQNECEENGYNWTENYSIVYDDMDQIECEINGYTWFHDQCIDLDAEICIEDIYGCMEDVDVWENWDITLRDLVIVNREGYEVARLNLTYANPDPNSTCGENYQTIKQLIIDAR